MREADTEGHTWYDSPDGKRPEQADPQTQGVGSWLLAYEQGTAHGDGASLWGCGMF